MKVVFKAPDRGHKALKGFETGYSGWALSYLIKQVIGDLINFLCIKVNY